MNSLNLMYSFLFTVQENTTCLLVMATSSFNKRLVTVVIKKAKGVTFVPWFFTRVTQPFVRQSTYLGSSTPVDATKVEPDLFILILRFFAPSIDERYSVGVKSPNWFIANLNFALPLLCSLMYYKKSICFLKLTFLANDAISICRGR